MNLMSFRSFLALFYLLPESEASLLPPGRMFQCRGKYRLHWAAQLGGKLERFQRYGQAEAETSHYPSTSAGVG